MPRRAQSPGQPLIPQIGLALALIAMASEVPACQVPRPQAVPKDHDRLPGEAVGPARKDIEDAIRALGREPVSDALVDRIDALYRPRWASSRTFEDDRKVLADPAFVAKVDSSAKAATQKPADTWTLFQFAGKNYVNADESTIRETIRLEAEGEAGPRKAIKGRIVDDETGRPIAGAVVSALGKALARADAKGDYLLTLPRPASVNGGAQAFPLTIEAPGYALTQTGLNWDEIAEAHILDYRLPRAVVFGGRIIDPLGKPVVGAELMLYMRIDPIGRDGTMMRLGIGNAVVFRARTDARGDYAFRNVPPDDGPRQAAYNLSISHPKYQSRRKVYNQNELLGPGWEITMEEGATIRGRLVDESGKPVAKVAILAMAQPVTGAYPTATTDADGKFRIDSLAPGPVQLLVRPAGFVFKRVEAQADKGEPAEVQITVEKGDYFEGKVVDADDKPVSGATVGYIQPVDAKGAIQPNQNINMGSPNARTGPDGKFRIGPVAKGRYRVMAIFNTPTQGQANGTIDADSGAKELMIKLGAGPGNQ